MRIDQWSRISQSIRFKVDLADGKFSEDDLEVNVEDSQPDTIKRGGSFTVGHIILGAVQKHRYSLQQVSATCADDPAFTRLHGKFSQFVRSEFASEFNSADLEIILDPSATVRFESGFFLLKANSRVQ